MQMKRRVNRTIIASLLFTLIMLTGCVIGKSEEPYLEDRTQGWKPKLTYYAEFPLWKLEAEDSELWTDIIDFKPFTFAEKLTKENFSNAAEEALRLNFGEAYNDIGGSYELVEVDNTMGFITDDYVVVFDTETGKLKFCADIEHTDVLKKQLDSLRLTIDLAELSAAELREIDDACGMIEGPPYPTNVIGVLKRPEVGDTPLPLAAEGAYALSVGMDVKSWGGSTPLAATGGAFKVYSGEASNTLFVVTNTYVQAFDVESGELILMCRYFSGGLGIRADGKDESQKL